MKWSYDLAGAEPIIKDMIVYNSTVISQGEYLQLGATAFTAGADASLALVNAVPSTVMATQGVNAVGISTQTISTAGNGLFYSLNAPASVATAANSTAGAAGGLRGTSAFAYAKVIINPLAVYRTPVGIGTTSGALSIASGATQDIAITGVPASAFDGSWVYFCATAGPNFGALKKVVSSATAGTQHLDTVLTTAATTADKVFIFSDRNSYPHALSSSGVTTANTNVGTSIGMTTVAGYGATQLRVLENYVESGQYVGGITQVRYEVQGNTSIFAGPTGPNQTSKPAQFWQDVISLSHAFKG